MALSFPEPPLQAGVFISAFRRLSEAKQKATRYAGGREKVIQKAHPSATIKVFGSIAGSKGERKKGARSDENSEHSEARGFVHFRIKKSVQPVQVERIWHRHGDSNPGFRRERATS